MRVWRCLPQRRWPATAASSLSALPLVFLLLGCGLYMTYYASVQIHQVAIETCQLAPYRRDLNPDNVQLQDGGPWLPKIVRELLFFWVIRCILLALWAPLLWRSPNKIGLLISMLLKTGGYFVGLTVVEELKLRSEDFECHTTHANGLSGHAFYGAWALCTIYYYYLHLVAELNERQPDMRWKKGSVGNEASYSAAYSVGDAITEEGLNQLRLGLTRREEERSPQIFKWIELVVYVVAPFCILTQLVYTYRYGYHSPRQMLLAASIGAIYCALSSLLSQVVLLAVRQTLSPFWSASKDKLV